MTLNEKQVHFSNLFARLVLWAHSYDEVVIDAVARSPEEQARLVAIGASHTLNSKHVHRLAGDLLLFRNGAYVQDGKEYAPLGAYWKSLDPHNVWGGDWSSLHDYGHFEYAG